MNNTIALPE